MRKSVVVVLSALMVALPIGGMTACGSAGAKRSEYKIEAEYFEEDRRLEASAEIVVYNGSDNAYSVLPFMLWGNAYGAGAKLAPASVHGEDLGGVKINEVTGAEYSLGGADGTVMYLALREPLYAGERTTLTVDYTLILAKTEHRLGVGENCVNLSWFYPVLCAAGVEGFLEYAEEGFGESFVCDCADFDVTLTVPEKFTAAYGGEGSEVAENGKKTYHVVAKNTRDVAFVLGEFQTVSGECGGVPVQYRYFRDEFPEETLRVALKAVETFEKLFGDYPFDKYTLAETDFPLGGMEYSAFAVLSCALRHEERAEVVVHETAHQWWYASVGSNQYENAWQDEGLAEYSVALFYECNADYGDYRKSVNASEHAYRAYFSVASQLSDEVNTAMTRPLSSFSGEYDYRVIAYDKGVVMFDRVRETVGNRRFFAGLKSYAQKYGGKIASPEDLISCFGAERLFASFLEGKCVI